MSNHHNDPSLLTDDLAAEILALAKTRLAAGDLDAAARALRAIVRYPATRLEAHNLIERHGFAGSFREMMGVKSEISPADDIFRFFAGHPTSVNPLRDYLADGWRTLSELMLLLEAVDQPLLKASSFLEFASGHGRFTRHLVKVLGAEKVTAADVVGDAVEFSRATFGVRGILSSLVPEEVRFPERYDVVFVLSLFSHLPRSTWTRWLASLYGSVAPGGLLVFTTHGDQSAARHRVTLEDDGFFFAPSSESSAIEAAQYGTTFTSDAFVRARIQETAGAGALVHVAPLHFWNHQDAYVLRRR